MFDGRFEKSGQVPLVFKPRYDRGLWLVFLALLLLPMGRAVSLVIADQLQLAWFLLGVTGLAALALWSWLPRAFELWPDHIRIVLGSPWGPNIPLDGIVLVQPGNGAACWASLGALFATSFKTPVQIRRNKGMIVLISRDNPGELIEGLKAAIARTHGCLL